MAKIINGKEISTQLKDELKEKVAQLKEPLPLCRSVIIRRLPFM